MKTSLLIIALTATITTALAGDAGPWVAGTVADINRVIRLVVDGRAEITGRLPDAWSWRCIDPKGCR